MTDVATIEPSKMGRPRRVIPTTSVKVEEDAAEMVRKASTFLGLSVVEYASRVLREQARKDLREGAERFLREDNPDPPATKPKTKR